MSERVKTCPFCNKEGVREIYIPAMKKVTHLSDKSSRSTTTTAEQVSILDDCPNCGKTKKEIELYYKKGVQRTHKERLERLKKRGLSLVIGGEK